MKTINIQSTTRLGILLKTFPALEETIIKMSPVYKNLKNPILRRTVAKIATLEKVAEIGGIPVTEFVNRLRTEVGQDTLESDANQENAPAILKEDPGWIKGEPAEILDGVEMLNRGEHPLGKIQQIMQGLEKGKFILLVTNFKPVPLIETMAQQKYPVHYRQDPDQKDRHLTFIGKQ